MELYKAVFRASGRSGAGVVTLSDGRLLGGDSTHSFDGGYTLNGTRVTATLRVRKHTDGGISLLGQDNVTIQLIGEIDAGKGTLKGVGVPLEVILTKISD